VFESHLLGSVYKQIVPPLTDYDDVIDTQAKNCMTNQIAHAMPLNLTLSNKSETQFNNSVSLIVKPFSVT